MRIASGIGSAAARCAQSQAACTGCPNGNRRRLQLGEIPVSRPGRDQVPAAAHRVPVSRTGHQHAPARKQGGNHGPELPRAGTGAPRRAVEPLAVASQVAAGNPALAYAALMTDAYPPFPLDQGGAGVPTPAPDDLTPASAATAPAQAAPVS